MTFLASTVMVPVVASDGRFDVIPTDFLCGVVVIVSLVAVLINWREISVDVVVRSSDVSEMLLVDFTSGVIGSVPVEVVVGVFGIVPLETMIGAVVNVRVETIVGFGGSRRCNGSC